mgnify:CR=1 FL=1
MAEDNARRVCRDRRERHVLGRDLSEIATYARVDNWQFRLLRQFTPGPYTFVLAATKELPRRVAHEKRKTIGIRVPDHAICQALLAELQEPLLTSTLQMPGDDYPLNDPEDVKDRLGSRLDLIVDGGYGTLEPTTVVDLTGDSPVVLRQGRGDPQPFS